MKIFICVPSNRPWVPAFGQSIMGLMQYIYQKGAGGKYPIHAVFHLQSNASLLPASRQKAIDAIVKEKADYALFLDDDICFPPNIIDTFLSRDVDFIAANYVSKGVQGRPTAQGAGQPIFSRGKTGIEEAGWIGLGCCLIRVAAIAHIPPPHFEVQWLPETQTYMGEDYMFSEILRRNDIKIYVDHDVSNKISHVGDFQFTERTLDSFKALVD